MTIAIKPTASGSTIEQNGSTILTVDSSGNITPSNQLYPKVPAFFATNSSAQSISSNTLVKVILDTSVFDTDNYFDNSTNYRFTPTIAGYYQINSTLRVEGTSTSGVSIDIRKNGFNYYRVALDRETISASRVVSGSTLVYLNGSTDYIEMYGTVVSGSSITFGYINPNSACGMSGHLVSV